MYTYVTLLPPLEIGRLLLLLLFAAWAMGCSAQMAAYCLRFRGPEHLRAQIGAPDVDQPPQARNPVRSVRPLDRQ